MLRSFKDKQGRKRDGQSVKQQQRGEIRQDGTSTDGSNRGEANVLTHLPETSMCRVASCNCQQGLLRGTAKLAVLIFTAMTSTGGLSNAYLRVGDSRLTFPSPAAATQRATPVRRWRPNPPTLEEQWTLSSMPSNRGPLSSAHPSCDCVLPGCH